MKNLQARSNASVQGSDGMKSLFGAITVAIAGNSANTDPPTLQWSL
jgi:hypothetical protein